MPEEISKGLWRFEDSCNVYVVCCGDHAVAIDFGSGRWLPELESIGVNRLDHVYLTHHHADQCYGLAALSEREFEVHAPAGEELFLDSAIRSGRMTSAHLGKGCPASYHAPVQPIAGINYDMTGFGDLFWENRRIRFLHTPGHGAHACSVVMDHGDRQIVFCGDAVHAGGTLHRPYNLEWDHWTGAGALAAWEGVCRLSGVAMDMLCPAHGPVISAGCGETVELLGRRLLAFYHAKGAVSPGEKDEYVEMTVLPCGARRILPSLYQFGANGYLLLSGSGEALVIDPYEGDMPALEALLNYLGDVRITAAAVSHYHFDHCDGIPRLRQRYGCKLYLHPLVAEPLSNVRASVLPWLPEQDILPDEFWPNEGVWRWHEYKFEVAHWPGQTWWHCAFMTAVNGRKVLFGGDSFQPSSRWNGTGGFCSYNNSRFADGFIPSALKALEWSPDVLAAGHGTCYRFRPSKFRKIAVWAETAALALTELCPTGSLEEDYYSVCRPRRERDAEGIFLWPSV